MIVTIFYSDSENFIHPRKTIIFKVNKQCVVQMQYQSTLQEQERKNNKTKEEKSTNQ